MDKSALKEKNIWLLIVSLLLIGCGIYVLFNPITALITSAVVLGIIFVFMGIGYMLAFRNTHSYALLAIGILDLLIGIIFLSNIGITALTMPIIFALWCLFIGILQIISGLEMREIDDPAWGWITGAGIFGIIFSLLIFFYPILGTLTITLLIGAYLIIYGGFELNRFIRGI